MAPDPSKKHRQQAHQYIHPAVKKVMIRLCSFFKPEVVGLLLEVNPRTVRRTWARFKATGEVASTNKGGRKKKLGDDEMEFVAELLKKRGDLYLDEIQDYLKETGMRTASLPTICRALAKKGYTKKKLSKQAIERNETRRSEYCMEIAEKYTREQLVFVDESACDTRLLNRTHGYGIRGKRIFRKDEFGRGIKYSVLPALSLDGIIDMTVLEGSFNGELFANFIEGLVNVMNPFPATNSILVMDNCKIHRNWRVPELCQARGVQLVYLPPYSPDYNPIEQAFSAVKAYLRRHGSKLRYAIKTGGKDAPMRILLRRY